LFLYPLALHSFPTRRSSDLLKTSLLSFTLALFHLTGFGQVIKGTVRDNETQKPLRYATVSVIGQNLRIITRSDGAFTLDVSGARSEEHTSELQSRENLVCRL